VLRIARCLRGILSMWRMRMLVCQSACSWVASFSLSVTDLKTPLRNTPVVPAAAQLDFRTVYSLSSGGCNIQLSKPSGLSSGGKQQAEPGSTLRSHLMYRMKYCRKCAGDGWIGRQGQKRTVPEMSREVRLRIFSCGRRALHMPTGTLPHLSQLLCL
jgi:hypothetical protein